MCNSSTYFAIISVIIIVIDSKLFIVSIAQNLNVIQTCFFFFQFVDLLITLSGITLLVRHLQ